MRTLDWYFDVISPFAYLQSEQLDAIEALGSVRYKPLLFAGLLSHFGNVGPAEIEVKRRATFDRVAWTAHSRGTPLAFPPAHPFNPIPLLRFIIAAGNTRGAVHAAFRFVWQAGHAPTDEMAFASLLESSGLTVAAINAPHVKQALLDNGNEAAARGVFGVPTTLVDNEAFWGDDALPMLKAYCAGDPFFSSELLRSARALPNGIQRKRD